MFRKLQLKMTLYYTGILMLILLVTNGAMYFLFTSYNNYQLSNETEDMLRSIESSEWIQVGIDQEKIEDLSGYIEENDNDVDSENENDSELNSDLNENETEENDDNVKPSETQETMGSEKSEDTEDTEKPEITETSEDTEKPEDTEEPDEIEKPEDTEESDETEKPEDIKEPDETEKPEAIQRSFIAAVNNWINNSVWIHVNASDSDVPVANTDGSTEANTDIEITRKPFSVTPKVGELIIPESLNNFAFYLIYENDGQLIYEKSISVSEELLPLLKLKAGEIELEGEPKVVSIGEVNTSHFLMMKMPILIEDKQVGYYCVGRDITLVYETLENLFRIIVISVVIGLLISIGLGYLLAGRSLKPIKETYESKQKFLADVSHELRTPLSVMMLSSETLEREISKENTFQLDALADIKAETVKMSGLVENLLLFARSDNRKLLPTIQLVNISRLIEVLNNGYVYIAKNKEITLYNDIERDITIEGDEKLLSSLFSILIDNGLKYTKRNGSVSIRLEKEKVKEKEGIRFIVKDTGIGIHKADLNHIFNRFYRVSDNSDKESGGYGLGLSIAKEIVEVHGGIIKAESEKDKGSTFMVWLPLNNK